jgi:hypothetical protein
MKKTTCISVNTALDKKSEGIKLGATHQKKHDDLMALVERLKIKESKATPSHLPV